MDTLDRLLDHNLWATQRLLECCRDLTFEQFTQRFDIGPGSLYDTLEHIIGTMQRWADRIEDRPLYSCPEDDHRILDVAELENMLKIAGHDLATAARHIRDEKRLDEMIQFIVPDRGEPYVFTRGTAIVHVLTHGVHHRAQALNMLRHLSKQCLPDLDVVEWELETGHKKPA